MAIFALSDLHLPLGIDKPMDVFGVRWDNYVEKIEKALEKCRKSQDENDRSEQVFSIQKKLRQLPVFMRF